MRPYPSGSSSSGLKGAVAGALARNGFVAGVLVLAAGCGSAVAQDTSAGGASDDAPAAARALVEEVLRRLGSGGGDGLGAWTRSVVERATRVVRLLAWVTAFACAVLTFGILASAAAYADDPRAAVREGASPHPNDVPDAERPEHEPAPRAVREWTPPPTEPRRRADGRRALHLLVPCRRTAASADEFQVPGLGRVRVRDTVDPTADIRSCRVVETTHRGTPTAKRRYALHVQAGSAVPSVGDHAIGDIGVDLGVATTVALSDGRRLRRPDHGAQLLRARGLARHAARRCKRGARQYRKCRRTARRIRRDVHRANEHFERHAALDVIDGQRLVGVESLRLRNLTASGRGTPTAPGSDAKRGLHRALAERRALKTGCDLVGVHPGNTSITCNRCGHTDKASRRSQALFECTRCGHREHADVNAAGNVRDRARARLDAFHAQRQANHGRRGPSSGSGRSNGQGPATRRTKAVPAHSASRKRGRAAGPRKGMTTQPKTGPPPGVESCM